MDIGCSPIQAADWLTQREESTGSGILALSTDFWSFVPNSFLIAVGDTGCHANTNYHANLVISAVETLVREKPIPFYACSRIRVVPSSKILIYLERYLPRKIFTGIKPRVR